jgi:hypothetical protein
VDLEDLVVVVVQQEILVFLVNHHGLVLVEPEETAD